MSEQGNEEVVRRLFEAIDARRSDIIGELLSDDFVSEYPQSGEKIVGGEKLIEVGRAAPDAPTLKIRRIHSGGAMVAVEADQTYTSGESWFATMIYMLKDGKITHEIGYWSKPFPAPEWRQKWVEK